jgi:hypothetical protein
VNDLLKLAVEAHGGLSRWEQFNMLKAGMSVTEALWGGSVVNMSSGLGLAGGTGISAYVQTRHHRPYEKRGARTKGTRNPGKCMRARPHLQGSKAKCECVHIAGRNFRVCDYSFRISPGFRGSQCP